MLHYTKINNNNNNYHHTVLINLSIHKLEYIYIPTTTSILRNNFKIADIVYVHKLQLHYIAKAKYNYIYIGNNKY